MIRQRIDVHTKSQKMRQQCQQNVEKFELRKFSRKTNLRQNITDTVQSTFGDVRYRHSPAGPYICYNSLLLYRETRTTSKSLVGSTKQYQPSIFVNFTESKLEQYKASSNTALKCETTSIKTLHLLHTLFIGFTQQISHFISRNVT